MTTQSVATTKRWITQNGEVLKIQDMKTSHIFFALRMLYNHSVPTTMQIAGCKQYQLHMNSSKRKQALEDLVHELRVRSDVTPFMWKQLEHMRNTLTRRKLL